MAVRRLFYSIGVIGAVVFYLMYQKWFSWIVLVSVLLLPWISLLLSLYPMFTFRVNLEAPEKITMCEHNYVEFHMSGSPVHPPFSYKFRVTKPITGETWIVKPDGGVPNIHCGTLVYRSEKIYIYDYMCLFRRRIRQQIGCRIQIMPKPVPMDVPEELNRLLSHAWRPKAGGGYAENHEIRPYRPGDSLNLVHWKLSAKVDSLMLREPMEPQQAKIFLKMDVCGTPDELDRKFGRLLWLGNWLLERNVSFTVLAMTGNGMETWLVSDEWSFDVCLRELLAAPFIRGTGSVKDRKTHAAWQIEIGGEPDED